VFSAEPVCSCAHFLVHHARETAGAARTRSSPRPLFFEGQVPAKLRAPRAARNVKSYSRFRKDGWSAAIPITSRAVLMGIASLHPPALGAV